MFFFCFCFDFTVDPHIIKNKEAYDEFLKATNSFGNFLSNFPKVILVLCMYVCMLLLLLCITIMYVCMYVLLCM